MNSSDRDTEASPKKKMK